MPVNSAPRPSSTGARDFGPPMGRNGANAPQPLPGPAAELVVDQPGSMRLRENLGSGDFGRWIAWPVAMSRC